MKHLNLKKIIGTTCMLSYLLVPLATAGPEDNIFEIPVNNIRSGPNVGNVERLTFENGQFKAALNGKIYAINSYDVDNKIQEIVNGGLLKEFINANGKLIIRQLEKPNQIEKDYTISEGGELKGGMFFLPVVGALAARTVVQIGAKELAKMAAKKAAKAAAKKIGKKAAVAVAGGTIKGCKEYNKAAKNK